MNAHVSQGGWPVLVLNADFRPLSYYPLSLWSWQDAIKAVFLDRVTGCYYIGYPKSSVTPRMMGDGEQLCVTPEDVEP